jgi:hypothetical protein
MCVLSHANIFSHIHTERRGVGAADKMQIGRHVNFTNAFRPGVNSRAGGLSGWHCLYYAHTHNTQTDKTHFFSDGNCSLCFAGVGAAECAGAGRLPRSPAAGRRHRRGRLPRHAQKKTQSQAQEKCRGEFQRIDTRYLFWFNTRLFCLGISIPHMQIETRTLQQGKKRKSNVLQSKEDVSNF